jgi:hypothetical protein
MVEEAVEVTVAEGAVAATKRLPMTPELLKNLESPRAESLIVGGLDVGDSVGRELSRISHGNVWDATRHGHRP